MTPHRTAVGWQPGIPADCGKIAELIRFRHWVVDCFGPMPPLQEDVNGNISDAYNNLDKT